MLWVLHCGRASVGAGLWLGSNRRLFKECRPSSPRAEKLQSWATGEQAEACLLSPAGSPSLSHLAGGATRGPRAQDLRAKAGQGQTGGQPEAGPPDHLSQSVSDNSDVVINRG